MEDYIDNIKAGCSGQVNIMGQTILHCGSLLPADHRRQDRQFDHRFANRHCKPDAADYYQ